MAGGNTTVLVHRYLDALARQMPAEPLIRDLLERAAHRLRRLCATLLRRSYPRLTQPPVNLETDELLGGVVAGLLTALRTVRPQTVRQFFALANRHMRWQLNDLARLLDERPSAAALAESGVAALPGSSDSCLSQDARRMRHARRTVLPVCLRPVCPQFVTFAWHSLRGCVLSERLLKADSRRVSNTFAQSLSPSRLVTCRALP